MFPAVPGEEGRGLPIAHSGPVLAEQFVFSTPYVWPSDDRRSVAGLTVAPLHAAAVTAAQKWPEAYRMLSLIEALRVGRARERKLAKHALGERLLHSDTPP